MTIGIGLYFQCLHAMDGQSSEQFLGSRPADVNSLSRGLPVTESSWSALLMTEPSRQRRSEHDADAVFNAQGGLVS
jgi:hypothetical protein